MISIRATGRPIAAIHQTGDGTGLGAQIADGNGSSTSPIALPARRGLLAAGSRGHDRMTVVEAWLVPRIAIDRANDSHANATGGEPQLLQDQSRSRHADPVPHQRADVMSVVTVTLAA
jgi:hypothetical protein